MRLIDKFVSPPEEKYTLLPTTLPTWGGRKKNRIAFAFNIDTNFYRILSFDSNHKTIFEPVEKKFIEETSFDAMLAEVTIQLEDIRKQVDEKFLRVGTYIPSHFGLLRMYTFPGNLNKKEVLQSLSLYIQQEIAETYKEKNVVYSYAFLSKGSAEEPYKILVTIVEKEPIDTLLNWAETNNIILDIISFELVCLLNLGLMKKLPKPFSILYTELNKIILFAYQNDRIIYEVFPYLFSTESGFEDTLNMLIWDIRNYIVLNDITNLFIAGIVVEHEALTQYFLERLPIFGIVSIEEFPQRYSLLYTLGERLLNV